MTTATRKLAAAAVVGAAYAALTALLAFMSYGPIQFRVAEALCVLPFFLPCSAWGLFAGCAVSNLLSSAGPLDVVFGSLATLCAALCSSALGRSYRAQGALPSLGRRLAVCAMPVVWNGPVVGAVIAYTSAPENFLPALALFGAEVMAGEAAVMALLGLPLTRLLTKNGALSAAIKKLGD